MIELRSIREFTRKGQTTPEKYDSPLSPPINLESINSIIDNADSIVESIPADERHNVFFTVGHKPEDTTSDGRAWIKQDVIPFDIDNCTYIDNKPDPKYLEALGEALQIDTRKCMIVATGNGLQVLIKPKFQITDASWFKKNEKYYLALSHKISDTLRKYGLEGELDPSSFATNRLFRLPLTSNIKPNKPTRTAQFINRNLETVDWDLARASGLEILDDTDTVPVKQISRLMVDTDAVQSGCEFLKHAKLNQVNITEPQWYAALSIVGRLDNGNELAHAYSVNHRSYSQHTTEKKLEQSLKSSGPRTCDNINKLWGRCSECPNFKKVTSPILIKGEDFIATRNCGFHIMGAKGGYIPQYKDLMKFYEEKNKFINVAKSNYTFDGTKWVRRDDEEVKGFAEEHFVPSCNNSKAAEFFGAVTRNNIERPDFFTDTTKNKMNFKNGVLDIDTMKFEPPNPEHGFTWCLPYDYDPIAKAPQFEKFLKDFTENDESKAQVLQEYAGYAIAGSEPKAQKFLTLVGEGSNGKSTFIELLTELVGGEDNGAVSSLDLLDLSRQFDRVALLSARFNVIDESQTRVDAGLWEKLKNYVTGGLVGAAYKGKTAFQFKNKCKFILLVNEIPKGANPNKGFYRRFLIVPCTATFEGKKVDRDIRRRIAASELPGIMNWALAGFKRLVDQGYQFSASAAVDRALIEYQMESNNVAQWCEDHVVLEEPTKLGPWLIANGKGKIVASTSKMRESFNEWIESRGEKEIGETTFSLRLKVWLRDKGYDWDNSRKKFKIEGHSVWALDGVNERNDPDDVPAPF